MRSPPKKIRPINKIPETPKVQNRYTRSISEVATPMSFLQFHRRKPSDSIWDVVEAVASPIDLSTSPRKQNLVAKMTKPSTSKSDKNNTLSHFITYRDPTLSISKSLMDTSLSTNYNTREEDMVIEDIIATTANPLDFPSSPPQSYNMNISGSPGVQKTYGKGRTIIRQDLDSLLSDTFIPSSRFQSNEDIEDDIIIKKNELKSSHELREVGGNARFVDEMNYILD
ncbi:4001_t:CDS:2, partial [Scutellospora calospora]